MSPTARTAEPTRMIRAKHETVARIEYHRQRLQKAHEEGRIVIPASGWAGKGRAEQVTTDYVLGRLLDELEGHRERSRKAARKSTDNVDGDAYASFGHPDADDLARKS